MTEMYIRFGDLSAEGASWNAELDEPEPGISVYRAEWTTQDHSVISIMLRSDAEYMGGVVTGLFDRPVYIVTGDLLGQRGGDGEPLMVNCHAELIGPVEIVNYVIEDEDD
jgi:hypothetical protein